MKTTIELPEPLFRKAKETALRRRTTLKQLITKALEREVAPYPTADDESVFQVDEDGLPYLPARDVKVTNETVADIQDEEES